MSAPHLFYLPSSFSSATLAACSQILLSTYATLVAVNISRVECFKRRLQTRHHHHVRWLNSHSGCFCKTSRHLSDDLYLPHLLFQWVPRRHPLPALELLFGHSMVSKGYEPTCKWQLSLHYHGYSDIHHYYFTQNHHCSLFHSVASNGHLLC